MAIVVIRGAPAQVEWGDAFKQNITPAVGRAARVAQKNLHRAANATYIQATRQVDSEKCRTFGSPTTAEIILATPIIFVQIVVLSAFGCAIIILAPFVSAVALPIFGIKALFDRYNHSKLYGRTLTNNARQEFGRIQGQDYTQWNGKAGKHLKAQLTEKDCEYELIGYHRHGLSDWGSSKHLPPESPVNSPFTTAEDLAWLNKEFKRREAKDALNFDLSMLRMFSKALIPLVGWFWALSEKDDPWVGKDGIGTHWKWQQAIDFHRKNLRARILK
jgi:hypothetical protein